jgi:hypothetical protein
MGVSLGNFKIGKFRRGLSSEAHHELFVTMTPAIPRTAMMSHADESKESQQKSRSQPQPSRSIFNVPAPIKQLFDRFPLLTYPTNDLPQRAPQHGDAHVLYIFTSEDGARRGLPSYNPACLKWQVRASYDVLHAPTHNIVGLPQVLQNRLHHSSGK